MPKFRVVYALILLVLCGWAFAQLPTPTPSNDDVVKISTNLIQIDLTVTDKDGKVIRDLKPGDFQIYQNGKKQTLSSFSFVSDSRETEQRRDTMVVSPSVSQVPQPAKPIRSSQVRRTIALIVDDLSLSLDTIENIRRTLRKFVDEQMQDGDLVAILRTGAGIGTLQQFTSDRRLLHAAIERINWNIIGTGSIGAFPAMEPESPTEERESSEKHGAGVRTAAGRRKEFEDFRAGVFATGTLGAINYVVQGMEDLPGRKSIVLLSQGFKLYQEDATGFRERGRVWVPLQKLIDRANRASVTIYTLDPRGLVYAGLTAADDVGNRSPAKVQKEIEDRQRRILDTQAGLQYLAKQTGGFALINDNDLSRGIERVLDDQSYYLIGFVPDEDTFDPRSARFNNIEIKLDRPGAELRYRSGFFGVADNTAAAEKNSKENKLLSALVSPFAANQITVRLNALFNSSTQSGPYLHSFLHVKADDLSFEEMPDGSKKVVFDVIAMVFGDNGSIVDRINKIYSVTVKKEAFESFMKEGLVYNFTFPMKKPGVYQLRVALRDQKSQKVGSANQFVEIPDIKKDALALSGIMLENKPLSDLKTAGIGAVNTQRSDPLTDTSLRRFKRGTVLNYEFSIFHAKSAAGNFKTQMRLYKDGKLVYSGQPQTVPPQADGKSFTPLEGSLVLGQDMTPGDYLLQLTATDEGGGKGATASQFVEFEIIE